MHKGVSVVQTLNLPKVQTLRFLSGTPKPYFEALIPKIEELIINQEILGKYKNVAPIIKAVKSKCVDHLTDQTVTKTCQFKEMKNVEKVSDSPKLVSNLGVQLSHRSQENESDFSQNQENFNEQTKSLSFRNIEKFTSVTVLVGGLIIGTCSILVNVLSSTDNLLLL